MAPGEIGLDDAIEQPSEEHLSEQRRRQHHHEERDHQRDGAQVCGLQRVIEPVTQCAQRQVDRPEDDDRDWHHQQHAVDVYANRAGEYGRRQLQ